MCYFAIFTVSVHCSFLFAQGLRVRSAARVNIYILLDVLVCSIAAYFYDLRWILTSPLGRVKIQTRSKNTQRY